MMPRLGAYFVVAGLLLCSLSDGSGQDARFHSRRAQYEIANGSAVRALEFYQMAYLEVVMASDSNLKYRVLNNIGACQMALFRYREAAQTLLQVRRSAEAGHDAALLGDADGNLAAVYTQMGDLPTAEMYARESIEACLRTHQPQQAVRAYLSLATILSRQQLIQEGDQYFREAVRIAVSTGDANSAAHAWLRYGDVLLANGRLEDAGHALAASRRVWGRKLKDEDALLWSLSRLRLRQGDRAQALKLIDSALQVNQTEGRIPKWRLYETRAEVELENGNAIAALADARESLGGPGGFAPT